MDSFTWSRDSLDRAANILRLLSSIHRVAAESRCETVRYIAERRRAVLVRPRCDIEQLRKIASATRFPNWKPPEYPPVTCGETREHLEAERFLVGIEISVLENLSESHEPIAPVASLFLAPLRLQMQVLEKELRTN